MNQKILVAYASRAGSTAEIAQAIGKVLEAQGVVVDVLPVNAVTGVKDYRAVVIGSAVRYGQWLSEATKFVEKFRAELSGKPVAYFAAYLMNQGEDEVNRKARQAYFAAARGLVAPKAEACFTGVGDMAKVALFERIIGKLVKSPEGDFRDWNAIRAWAESLKTIL